MASDPGAGLADYRALALSQLRNLYLLSDRYEPKVEAFGPGGVTTAMPTAWEEQDTTRKRLEVFQRNALSRGRALLEELIARTRLSNWKRSPPPGWNSRTGTSGMTVARRRWRLIGRSSNCCSILIRPNCCSNGWGSRWNCRQTAPSGSPATGRGAPVVVHARYDVSATGKAGNIEVTTGTAPTTARREGAAQSGPDPVSSAYGQRRAGGRAATGQDYQVLD